MAIEEYVSDDPNVGTIVNFGPLGSDPNIYRFQLITSQTHKDEQLTFLDEATRTHAKIINEAQKTYGSSLTKYHSEKLTLNGHEALFVAYRQPMKSEFTLQGTTPAQIRYHALYFVNYDNKMVLFWVEVPDRPWGVGPTGDLIKRHEEPSVNRFVSSFQMVPAPLTNAQ